MGRGVAMLKNKFVLLSLIIFTVWLVIMLLLSFPISRYYAEKETYRYMKKQGIPIENIESKIIRKDYKLNGYYVHVKLKDDPEFQYEYNYFPTNKLFRYALLLDIYNNRNEDYLINGEKNGKIPKYLPLEDDESTISKIDIFRYLIELFK